MLRDELHRTCANVTDRVRRRDRSLAHLAASRFSHSRRRRFFHHFLVTTLQRTIALEQVNTMSELIGKHLNLSLIHI